MTCEVKRVRNRVVWSPEWNREIIGWTASYVRENKWRVDRASDFDDLMQDAWLVFRNICITYPRVTNPRVFMALYKRAIVNKFNDKSCHRSRRDASMPIAEGDASDLLMGRIGECSNAGYISALIDEMPEEMKLALDLLSQGVRHPASNPQPKKKLRKRENLSQRICRSLGIPAHTDPVANLKQLLST